MKHDNYNWTLKAALFKKLLTGLKSAIFIQGGCSFMTVIFLVFLLMGTVEGQTRADYAFAGLTGEVTTISSSVNTADCPVFSFPSKFRTARNFSIFW